jgi:AP-3 complex subunit mu
MYYVLDNTPYAMLCCAMLCLPLYPPRYNRFERDKVVSFVPPDGHFELMRYRPHHASRTIVPPLFCQPQISMDVGASQGHLSLTLGVRSDTSLVVPNRTPGSSAPLVVEDVVVSIPFSKSVKTVNLTTTTGTVLYDEATKIAKWTVGKFGLDKRPQVSGTVYRHGGAAGGAAGSGADWEACCVLPLELQWKLPTASVSGLSIGSLQLTNEAYKPYKGMRTMSQAGKFVVRCSS